MNKVSFSTKISLWASFGMLTFFCANLYSQKKQIDFQAYDSWKKLEKHQTSLSGAWISYEINPLKGDGYLYFYNRTLDKLDSIKRGKDASLSFNEDFIAYKLLPGYDTLRKSELKKIDKKKWPKDTLCIRLVKKDSLIKIPKVKSFSISEASNLLGYLTEKSDKKVETKKKKWFQKKKKPEKEVASDGFPFFVFSPEKGELLKEKNVTEFSLSKKGNYVAYIEHQKDKIDSFKLILFDSRNQIKKTVIAAKTAIQLPIWNEAETKISFIFSSDTSKIKQFELALVDLNSMKTTIYGDTNHVFFGKEQGVSEHRKPLFTENGRFLFFGKHQRIEPEKKDTLLESEKPKLDIWHYQDKTIQPQQLVNLKRDEKRNYLCVLDLKTDSFVQLSNDTLEVSPTSRLRGEYLLARSSENYKVEAQWTAPSRSDYYRINFNGKIDPIKTGIYYPGSLSPNGRYFSYFNPDLQEHRLIDLDLKTDNCVSSCSEKNINWVEDVNGMPMKAGPIGEIGFTANEQAFLLRSEFDLWSYDIAKQELTCLTEFEGEKSKTRFEPIFWSNDSVYVDFDNLYVKGFNTKTKSESIHQFIKHENHIDFKQVYSGDFSIVSTSRSKDKSTVLLRKSSVSQYPELTVLANDWKFEKEISKTNPQQNEYVWSTVELVKWKSYSGFELEGLVYKPTDFDVAKKYPLIVYYYELNSDELHTHHPPRPTASVVHPTEYASAGYVVFIPDIRYKPGYPARGAYDCIMSGTDYVLKKYTNIDSTRMGLQGQSWGGYQSAQLITMTKRYKAAMAGAPVGNMFSAYGGIRWGSGLNRQFQYESTQSRIGKTIWEAPELFIENSPIFHLPKVSTPLLIMHNDQDGAVPWYQGIEIYTGLRRLGKPCWMLNYNGDDHNLTKLANKIDLSIRMRQFFDHYLLEKPIPIWMSEGLPAIDKGKKLNYELDQE
jgi:dipeptidyl aminopeptidase/acylaminoacyl peptidase